MSQPPRGRRPRSLHGKSWTPGKRGGQGCTLDQQSTCALCLKGHDLAKGSLAEGRADRLRCTQIARGLREEDRYGRASVFAHVLEVLDDLQRDTDLVGEGYAFGRGAVKDREHQVAHGRGRQHAVPDEIVETLITGNALIDSIGFDQGTKRFGSRLRLEMVAVRR